MDETDKSENNEPVVALCQLKARPSFFDRLGGLNLVLVEHKVLR